MNIGPQEIEALTRIIMIIGGVGLVGWVVYRMVLMETLRPKNTSTRCGTCGKNITPPAGEFCPHCGTRLVVAPRQD